MAATKAALARRADRLAAEKAKQARDAREILAKEASAYLDEILESGTSYAEPESVDAIMRDVVLRRLGIERPGLARGILYFAIMSAAEPDVFDAIAALRTERDSMLHSKLEEHEIAMAEWRRSKPEPLPEPVRRGARRFAAHLRSLAKRRAA